MTDASVDAITEQVVAWRRDIHRNPELGFNEHRTSALVERELRNAGIETTRMAGTGVVGLLRGKNPGKTLALRADMDALPIAERSGEPFSSLVPDVMHACGHDAHTAMLLGAAVWLARERDEISGSIKFIFQPAEEGPGGALPMIEAGVLKNPDVAAAVMLHVFPLLPSGVIGLRAGPMTASSDSFDIEVIGRGGHGAYPQTGIDTIPAAAEIVSALQTIRSRETDPLEGVVVSVGTLHGGYRRNVIADHTRIEGTVRCLSEIVRQQMPARIERIAGGICSAYGARCDVKFEMGYPGVVNDEGLVAQIRDISRNTGGIRGVAELSSARMGGEDFAYFAQAVPGCMARLGVAPAGDPDTPMLHSPEFRIDESALSSGVAFFHALAKHLPRRL